MKKMKLLKKSRKYNISSDICLIVYDNTLLHSEKQNLIVQPNESLSKLTATELASAAKRLLRIEDAQQRIALALPNSEFVATTLKLPAIAEQNLKNAVSLQLPTLLPGYTKPLLLAVKAQKTGGQTVALWLPRERADELFTAFEEVGLLLSCILPRSLVTLPNDKEICQIYDEDETNITYLEWSGGSIRQWLQVSKTDCEYPELLSQLDRSLSSLTDDVERICKNKLADWENPQMPPPLSYNYAFVPDGTMAKLAASAKRKKQKYLLIASILLIVGIIGLTGVAINYKYRLNARLTEVKASTYELNRLKVEAGQINELIGAIKDFPQQEVSKILFKLNQLIPANSWITNFRIEKGKIEIEGYSPTPSELVTVLANEKNLFSNIEFRGSRREPGKTELNFSISFQIVGINLDEYLEKYFPKLK